MPKIDDSLKTDVVKWSAFYEHRIRTGSKVIFHLEAFVAKFMRSTVTTDVRHGGLRADNRGPGRLWW